jgi:hypothetical protein
MAAVPSDQHQPEQSAEQDARDDRQHGQTERSQEQIQDRRLFFRLLNDGDDEGLVLLKVHRPS